LSDDPIGLSRSVQIHHLIVVMGDGYDRGFRFVGILVAW
jgi:hypothetical protein